MDKPKSKLDLLEEEIRTFELPDTIQLNRWSKILNVKDFVDSHFLTLRSNSGKRTFLPFFERLLELRDLLANQGLSASDK